MTTAPTTTSIPLYRVQTYTIAEVGDKLQGQTKVKHVVMALLPGSQSKWGDQFNVKDISLWPLLEVGKTAVFILERQSLRKPEYDGSKEWHYWWGLIGIDPAYVPATYKMWAEQQPAKPTAPATATAPAGAQQPAQAQGRQEGPFRDATRVSIEKQTALKAAAEVTAAALPFWATDDTTKADVIGAFTVTLAEQYMSFLEAQQEEQA